jgi:muramoyltetrapeptide carboxypeptidase
MKNGETGATPFHVRVLAPSGNGLHFNRQTSEIGIARLQRAGVRVSFSKRIWNPGGNWTQAVEARVNDLVEAYTEPGISHVMAIYGGYNSIDVLAGLPYDLIKERGRLLIGSSDITAMHCALWSAVQAQGILGPGFGMLCDPRLNPGTLESLESALADCEGTIEAPGLVSNEALHLSEHPGEYRPHAWKVFRDGVAEGFLMGGNLPTMLALAGTKYFPLLDGDLLVVEHSTGTSPGEIDRNFAQLGLLGVLSRIRGLIVGAHELDAEKWIPSILGKHLRGYSYPVIYSVNCSHLDPLCSIPLGARGVLNTAGDAPTIVWQKKG